MLQNFFYYSGLVFWAAITLMAILLFAGFIHKKLQGSILYLRISVMWAKCFKRHIYTRAVTPEFKVALKERLSYLEKENIRKFEQKELKKILLRAPVTKKSKETVFDNE